MNIPSSQQCLSLMVNHEMPAHIQEHSHQVARIAVGLGHCLNRQGAGLNMELLEAGGLLHDIAKLHCLRTGENHGLVGGHMVRQIGYPRVAHIVEDHVRIAVSDLQYPVTESLVVNYADKRVKHTEVVTLEERFGDLVERYAVTIERRDFLNQFLSLMLRLEDMIFADLEIQPADIARWTRAMPSHGGILNAPGSERQGYRRQTDSGVMNRVSVHPMTTDGGCMAERMPRSL